MGALFGKHTKDEHADALADYLHNDELWAAKKINGKKLRQLLLGFAKQSQKNENFLETVWEELDPSTTTAFIEDWESAVGIPDDCFPGTGSIEERRIHVVAKLTAAVQTAQDFVAMGALLGLTVNIVPGIEKSGFPYTFPLMFFDSVKDARFSIVVEITEELTGGFPYTFPVVFGNAIVDIVRCFFNKLKPANCQVIIIEV